MNKKTVEIFIPFEIHLYDYFVGEEKSNYGYRPPKTTFLYEMEAYGIEELAPLFGAEEKWVQEHPYSELQMKITWKTDLEEQDIGHIVDLVAGQMSDGWGEGYEQEPFEVDTETNLHLYAEPQWWKITCLIDGDKFDWEKNNGTIYS